ncbi:MAG TPA: transketolase C-terminal domain-containing protein, partial [Actinomycetota bacterium]|nr:transketolase C-terminal domain-containing protein [Actinomycetota bacterium]
HSQSTEHWLLNVPGLVLAVPGTPADAYGLLRAAIRSDDPVIVFEHKAQLGDRAELDRGRLVRLGVAEVVRPGTDVTFVATQLMRARAIEAAERGDADGISVEVIDPRTVEPLDTGTILDSVARTGRLVCVQEAPPAGSWGATLIATAAEHAFDSLDAPPVLLGADVTPVPYASNLENLWMPSTQRILHAIGAVVRH